MGNACSYADMAIVIISLFIPLLICAVILMLHHILVPEKRYFSCLFLVVIFLHSLFRILYFFLWTNSHYYRHSCRPPGSDSAKLGMTVLRTLPEAFFLSLVSLNVHAFSYIIYILVDPKIVIAHCFAMLQHIVNVSVYFWLGLFYMMSGGPYHKLILLTLNWIIIVIELVNAGFFFSISMILKHGDFFRRIRSKNSSYIAPSSSATQNLFYASMVCFVTISCKAVMLISHEWRYHYDELWVLPAFFIFAELIPEIAMLIIQCFVGQYLRNYFHSNRMSHLGSLLNDRLSTIAEEPSFYGYVFSRSHTSVHKVGSKSRSYRWSKYSPKSFGSPSSEQHVIDVSPTMLSETKSNSTPKHAMYVPPKPVKKSKYKIASL